MGTNASPASSVTLSKDQLPAGFTVDGLIPSSSPIPKSKLPKGFKIDVPQESWRSAIGSIADPIIDVARPVVSGAAATAAGSATAASGLFDAGVSSLAAPVAAAGTYGLVDSILQHLKSYNPNSTLANVLALKENGLPANLANALEQRALVGVGNKVFGAGKGLINAFKNADQPELLKYLPTTGQALTSGGHNLTGTLSNFLENTFVPGSKEIAESNSAQAATSIGNKLAAKLAGRSPRIVTNPTTMTKLITGELVPEESVGEQKLVQKTVPFQPIKLTPQTADYQPIKITPGDEAQGATKTGYYKPPTLATVAPNGPVKSVATDSYNVTPGPVQQVPVPGSYEILPGVIKKTPYATDPASLDKLIANPDRLQEALTTS